MAGKKYKDKTADTEYKSKSKKRKNLSQILKNISSKMKKNDFLLTEEEAKNALFPEVKIEDLKNGYPQTLGDNNPYEASRDALISHKTNLTELKELVKKDDILKKIELYKVIDNNLMVHISNLEIIDNEIQTKINNISQNERGDRILVEVYKDQKKELQKEITSFLKEGENFFENNNIDKLNEFQEILETKLNKAKESFDPKLQDSNNILKKCSEKLEAKVLAFTEERKNAYGGGQKEEDYYNTGKGKILGKLESYLRINRESQNPKSIQVVIDQWKEDYKGGEEKPDWKTILKEDRSGRGGIGARFGFVNKTSSEKFLEQLEKDAKLIDQHCNIPKQSISSKNPTVENPKMEL